MWPIALPQTKVVHLLRLAWVPIHKRIRQRDGNESLRYQAYRLRVGCVSAAYPKQIRQKDGNESTAVSSVSAAYPKRIRQRDGNESTAVSSISVAYRLRIQNEYVKGMETNRRRYQAYRLRIGCVFKANTSKGWKRIDGGIKRIGCVSAAYPRCVMEAHDRQTDFFRMMTLEACNGPVANTVASSTTTGRQWGQHRLQGSCKRVNRPIRKRRSIGRSI
jgi:hypothetical protein